VTNDLGVPSFEVPEDEVYETFVENGWTDGLPIIIPTRARIEKMLAGTSRGRDEVVSIGGKSPLPNRWTYTVEQVAVNAVMSGARPEYFPLILALAASGHSARGGSTTSFGDMAIVNGPVRNELNMNSGIGAMGPFNHANSTIAYAWGLLSRNLMGGAVLGSQYVGSQGNPLMTASPVVPENEERSPWEPFHVEHGWAASDSTVSVFVGGWVSQFMNTVRQERWRENIARMLVGMDAHFPPMLVLDPIPAHEFIEREPAFADKQKLLDWVDEVSLMEARDFWNNREAQRHLRAPAAAGVEPWATNWAALERDPLSLVHKFDRGRITAVVIGGETAGTWRIYGSRYEGTYSVDDWR
jgi:hypothetical protein